MSRLQSLQLGHPARADHVEVVDDKISIYLFGQFSLSFNSVCTTSNYILIILDYLVFSTSKIVSNEVTLYVRACILPVPQVH